MYPTVASVLHDLARTAREQLTIIEQDTDRPEPVNAEATIRVTRARPSAYDKHPATRITMTVSVTLPDEQET